MTRPDWIEVGRIARAHGLQGEVRIDPSTDNPERFAPGSIVYVGPPGRELRCLEMTGIRGEAALPIVAFAGVETRDDAEALRGLALWVPGAELPALEEGEFYPFELEGLDVRTPDGVAVGRVEELLDAPANEVLVVRLVDGRQLLLPFVEAAVPSIDVDEGYLVVDGSFLPDPAPEDA
jgi:16S rRNA processing protein RimM